jgi:starch phosphorylase
MVSDYVQTLYEPTAQRSDTLTKKNFARAKELAAWKARVSEAWSSVRVVDVDSGPTTLAVTDLGDRRPVLVTVDLGQLSSSDVAVELLHGPVVAGDELSSTEVEGLTLRGPGDQPGTYCYEGELVCDQAGRHGFTVRVVPANPDLANPVEMGCVTWA